MKRSKIHRKGGGQSETHLNTCMKSMLQRCCLAEILTVISFAHSNSADRLVQVVSETESSLSYNRTSFKEQQIYGRCQM